MYLKTASKRYAKALMDSATENNLLEETYSEINSLKNILNSSIQLSEYLLNPTISKDDKESLIIKILGDEHSTLINLVNLLTINNRLDELEAIANSFNELYAKRKGCSNNVSFYLYPSEVCDLRGLTGDFAISVPELFRAISNNY